MIADEDIEEFKVWKRAKDKSGFDEVFYQLEQSLKDSGKRGFSPVMQGQAYRLLATAIVLLKKEVIKDE